MKNRGQANTPPHAFGHLPLRAIVPTTENGMKKQKMPEKYRVWIEARKQFKLSHAQIQMARELGLNPNKLGSLANNDQERWKEPLGEFIGTLYEKHFRKTAPEIVRSLEEMSQADMAKKELKKARKMAKETALAPSPKSDLAT